MRKRLALLALVFTLAMLPTPAHADVGSTIVGRFWDSLVATFRERLSSGAPTTVTLLQEAERTFLGQTEDITVMAPIRDVYKGMRVAGLLLLALCTVISLAGITEAGMLGQSSDLTDWAKRFGVATFMTMGGIHFYGLWIRIFNGMLSGFRSYLDTHWQGPNDPSALLTELILHLHTANTLLTIVFVIVTLVVLLILWFLIGGIRMAELALSVIIAPLVWPLYLLPALDDIPKVAFRSFLGLNGLLLIIVGMLRLSVRMVAGGGLANTVWNYVPALSLLILTVFLPTMIKRLVGQDNTGAGGLMTLAYLAAGAKGLSMAAAAGGAGAATAAPPAAAAVPKAPTGASAYPLANLGASGVTGSHSAPQSPPMEEVWHTAPQQLHSGAMAARPAALNAPVGAGSLTIDLRQSKPGSDRWDEIAAIHAFMDGSQAGQKPVEPEPEE